MGSRRHSALWRWRCQWGVVSLAALALVAYNGAARVWTEPACAPPAPAPSPATCEPCLEQVVTHSTTDVEPLASLDLRLGRWDNSRMYRLHDHAAVGATYADLSESSRVCLATQTSIERLPELLQIAEHWSGPISVAVFVVADELRGLRSFAWWLARCRPDLWARLALHVALPAERGGSTGRAALWPCGRKPPTPERAPDTVQWRARHAYPQNHMRNLARKNCHTPYVFLVDIDIVPSAGMAESLDRFLAHARCPLCAYVVPTYELDRRVATFPANKSELLRLSRYKLAVPFHRKVFIYNQYASNFSRWEASGGNESMETHISHNVTNFELFYEPFYVAPDNVPPHDERFLGYGFTRNTQVLDVTGSHEPFYVAPDNVPPHDERFLGYRFTRNTQPRGRRIPRIMMEARVPLVPHWICRLSYGDVLTSNMFCGGHFLIGGVSSCQVYEMLLQGYRFQVLSPVFSAQWGVHKRRDWPRWRVLQKDRNAILFVTKKKELFATYGKDPFRIMTTAPPKLKHYMFRNPWEKKWKQPKR